MSRGPRVTACGRDRDQDYRGQPSPVNWSRLVYLAQRRKPGALEVLQDAIEIYFPKQFKAEQAKARRYARQGGGEVYLVLSGRTARRRFEPAGKRRRGGTRALLRHPRAIPFFGLSRKDYLDDYYGPGGGPRRHMKAQFQASNVIVWSTRTGKDIGDVR